MLAVTADVLPLKQHAQRRRLVVLDIENINGGSVLFPRDADAAWNDVAFAIDLRESEQVVVGVGPSSLLASGISRPSARYVMRKGVDGADLALLEVLDGENVAQRFTDVVIASGDGMFADAAARLAAAGVFVTAVARENCLSKRLRLAAHAIQILPATGHGVGEAA
jgi:hypothetical protein